MEQYSHESDITKSKFNCEDIFYLPNVSRGKPFVIQCGNHSMQQKNTRGRKCRQKCASRHQGSENSNKHAPVPDMAHPSPRHTRYMPSVQKASIESRNFSNVFDYKNASLDYGNSKEKADIHYPLTPFPLRVPKSKAYEIAMMEDGIFMSDTSDVFFVHSISENFRVVDMWVCSCSCPAGVKCVVCSHLYAVGMIDRELGFRFSLFTFVKEKVQRAASSRFSETLTLENLASWVWEQFLVQIFDSFQIDILFSWLLKAFCGLLARVVQNSNSKLPTVVADSTLYNDSSAEECPSTNTSVIRSNSRFRASVCQLLKQKDEFSAKENVIERFLLFFQSLGRKYSSGVKALRLLKKMCNLNPSESPSPRLSTTSVLGCDRFSPCSDSEATELKPSSNDFKQILDWLEGTNSCLCTNHVEVIENCTQTENSSGTSTTVSDGTVKLNISRDDVEKLIGLLSELAPRHMTSLELLADVSVKFNALQNAFQFQKGISEVLFSIQKIYPALTQLPFLHLNNTKHELQYDVFHAMQCAVSCLFSSCLSAFHDTFEAIRCVRNYFDLPKSLECFGLDLEYKATDKDMAIYPLRFLDMKKLTSFYFMFLPSEGSHWNKRSLSSCELIEKALDSLFNAPVAIDLSKYIVWDEQFQNVLGSFDDFLLKKARFSKQLQNYLIVEVGFSVFIKLPRQINEELWPQALREMVTQSALLDAWGLSLTVLWHVKDSKENLARILRETPCLAAVSWSVLYDLHRWTPQSLYSVSKWFLTHFFEHHMSMWGDSDGLTSRQSSFLKCSSSWFRDKPHEQKDSEFINKEIGVSDCLEIEDMECNTGQNITTESVESDKLLREDWDRIIKDIWRDQFGLDENKTSCTALENVQNQRLNRAITRLSQDLYSCRSHFLLEMLQNTDDNTYLESVKESSSTGGVGPALCMITLPEGMAFVNNEKGFSPEDLRSLCDVGLSSKRKKQDETCEKKKIGRFGIGFKSVFTYSNSPAIFSNNLSMQFSFNDPSGLGALLPQPLGVGWETFCPRTLSRVVEQSGVFPSTLIWLPHNKEQSVEAGARVNCVEVFSPLWILFLNQIRTVKAYDISSSTHVAVHQSICYHTSQGSTLANCCFPHLCFEFQHIILSVHKGSFVSQHECLEEKILDKYELHFISFQNKAHGLRVAYPLDAKSCTALPSKHYQLYVYLPLQQIGLGFPAHGDFLLSSSRESVLLDAEENAERIRHLGTLIGSSLAKLANEINLSFLHFIPLESELLHTFKFLCITMRCELNAQLLIQHMSREPVYNSMQQKRFLIPLYADYLCESSMDSSQFSYEKLALHSLFTSFIHFEFPEGVLQLNTGPSVVSMDFINKASLDVCRKRLCLSDFGPWDVVDRLVQLETFWISNSNPPLEQTKLLCSFVGISLILLNQFSQANQLPLAVIETVRNLQIFPLSHFIQGCGVLNSEDRKLIVYEPKNEALCETFPAFRLLILRLCHVLHPFLFDWRECLDLLLLPLSSTIIVEKKKEEEVLSKLDSYLMDTLKRLSVLSVNDTELVSACFFPFLNSPQTPVDINLILSLSFVLFHYMDVITQLISSKGAINTLHVQFIKEQLGRSYIVLDHVHEKRLLASKAFLSATGARECLSFYICLKEVVKRESLTAMFSCSDSILSRVLTRRAAPSAKYWEIACFSHISFWDDFFTFWGAQPFWAPEPVSYKICLTEAPEVTCSLVEYPSFWSKDESVKVETFLQSDICVRRLLNPTFEKCGTQHILVEDFICLEFLVTCRLLEQFSSVVFLPKEDIYAIEECLAQVYRGIICHASEHLEASTNLNVKIPSSFQLQLRHSCWIPSLKPLSTRIGKNHSGFLKVFECEKESTGSFFLLSPPCTAVVFSAEHAQLLKYADWFTNIHSYVVMSETWYSQISANSSTPEQSKLFQLLEIQSHFPFLALLDLLISLAASIHEISEAQTKSTSANQETNELNCLLGAYWFTLSYLGRLVSTSVIDSKLLLQESYTATRQKLFDEQQYLVIYDERCKKWKKVSASVLYFSTPSSFMLNEFFACFSIESHMLKPFRRKEKQILSAIEIKSLQQGTIDDTILKNLFKIFFNVQESLTLTHFMKELEYLHLTSNENFKLKELKERQDFIGYLISCLYLYDLYSRNQDRRMSHENFELLTKFSTENKALSSFKVSYTGSHVSNHLEDMLFDKQLRVVPVKTLPCDFELLNIHQVISDPYVMLLITSLDAKIQALLARFLDRVDCEVKPRVICGAFQLDCFRIITSSGVQSWWNDFCLHVIRCPPVSQCFMPFYIGAEPINSFTYFAHTASLYFLHVVINLVLPLLFRFISFYCPSMLNQFHTCGDAKKIYSFFITMHWGWVTSSVLCRWTCRTDNRDFGEHEEIAVFFPSHEKAPWIVFAIGADYLEDTNALLLEALILHLFPFCSQFPFVSTICKLVTSLCSANELRIVENPLKRKCRFSNHLEQILFLSLKNSDVDLESSEGVFDDFQEWYNQLWNLAEQQEIVDEGQTAKIDFLSYLTSLVKFYFFSHEISSVSLQSYNLFTLKTPESNGLDDVARNSVACNTEKLESSSCTKERNVEGEGTFEYGLVTNYNFDQKYTEAEDSPLEKAEISRVDESHGKRRSKRQQKNSFCTELIQNGDDLRKMKLFKGATTFSEHLDSKLNGKENARSISILHSHREIIEENKCSQSPELHQEPCYRGIPDESFHFTDHETAAFYGETVICKGLLEKIGSSTASNADLIATGRSGEHIAYLYLLDAYHTEIQSSELSITWVNQFRETGLPYDIIMSWNAPSPKKGEKTYIEVKATSSYNKCYFEVSNLEWRFAQFEGDNYFIYRVFAVNSSDCSIIRIKNPYRQWKDQRMKLFLSF